MSAELPTFECVKIEREGPVTFVILNRPEKRNAMSPQLHLDMCDALDWAEEDDETRVVIVTGAGGNFCAGQDLKLYFRGTEGDPKARARARHAAHEWRWNKLSHVPQAHHRHGPWLLLRRRLHARHRLRLRHRRRRRDVRPFGSELGHHPRRPRRLGRDAGDGLSRRHVLFRDRREIHAARKRAR